MVTFELHFLLHPFYCPFVEVAEISVSVCESVCDCVCVHEYVFLIVSTQLLNYNHTITDIGYSYNMSGK